jgi:rhamnosyl/mannosyltransferase
MRVLHVFKTYYPDTRGGTEEFIHQLCTQARRLGVESDVFTLSATSHSGEKVVQGVKVISAKLSCKPFGVPWSWGAWRQFRSIVGQYDLIHFHHPWPFADLLYLFLARRKKALTTYHLDLVRAPWVVSVYRPLMRLFLSRMQAIVCTSEAYANSSKELIPFRDRLRIIPIGIDEEVYPAVDMARVAYWKKHLGEHFVLFIGAFRYYKGLSHLVEACVGTQISLVLLGDGPERARIENLIQHHGLDKQIYRVGALDDKDKRAILHLARGLVLPSSSRAEAFGISLLEGLMAGKPLISTELGTGTSWVNQDGKTGWVVLPQSPESLRQALLQLMTDDAAVLRMRQAARARYESMFTAAQMGQSYEALYKKLCQVNLV